MHDKKPTRGPLVVVATTKDAEGILTSQKTYTSDAELGAVLGASDFDNRGPTFTEQLSEQLQAPGPLSVPMGAWALGLVGLAWWGLS